MNANTPFETETMADLCARQGRFGAAISIYRNLLRAHPEDSLARRWQEKLQALEDAWQEEGGGPTLPHEVPVPPAPGVLAVPGQDDQGESVAIVAWALPPTPSPPVLEVMLVLRGPEGIETERRRVAVSSSSGRVALTAPGLHSVVAAAGVEQRGRFVPWTRSSLPGG